MAEVDSEYPTTLHINLRKDYRQKGAGQLLISVFEEYLKSKNRPGAHSATMSELQGLFFAAGD